jgi:hypothetical protein
VTVVGDGGHAPAAELDTWQLPCSDEWWRSELDQSHSEVPAERGACRPVRGPRPFDALARHLGCHDGVSLRSLAAGSRLIVGTQNSIYRLVVLDGTEGRVQVQGGTMFPEPTDVRLEGATDGGSAVKSGWIGIGLRFEVRGEGRRIVTSRVKSLTIDRADRDRDDVEDGASPA